MNPETIAEYDKSRNFAGKGVRSICYAAHANLYFDMFGRAKACCWNWQHPLGNVNTQTLDEIWAGARAQMLRRALENYDLTLGCGFCEQQTAEGWTTRAVMREFDRFPVAAAQPLWPRRMEFSISNSCNLECVMCSGVYSSAIRARREKLPPAAKIYPDTFIDSLRAYLPHLETAKFLGGEPFLVAEYYRIWDMMLDVAPHVNCHITTNGTQYNARIEKLLSKLKFSFAVSLDGATKATVESIRVNADYDEQLAILKILRQYTKQRGTDLSLTFCFMRQNWHEFGEFCAFADQWGCNVGINTVSNPPEFAVNNLPAEELRNIVTTMASQARQLDTLLTRNRGVWFAEFDRLRRKCDTAEQRAAQA